MILRLPQSPASTYSPEERLRGETKEVDNLPQEDKLALLRVIGGFLRDVKTKQTYAS
ncbi:MAG: hypothetical protein IT249_00940 [Chitinophagaceae bacterium]|nr:hypothetical protein [Chitinophagaceae bacterium]